MPEKNVVIKRIYHICHHIFGEVVTVQGQEKSHFIIRNLSFMQEIGIINENKHLISKYLEVILSCFRGALGLCNGSFTNVRENV